MQLYTSVGVDGGGGDDDGDNRSGIAIGNWNLTRTTMTDDDAG